MHSTTGLSPFEIVYGFNPLTPLDLIPLPVSEIHSLDGKKKAELVKSIHEKVRSQIAKWNEQVVAYVNKGRRRVLPSWAIGFGCTLGRKGFLTKGNPSLI